MPSPYVARIPETSYRMLYRAMAAVPALRNLMRIERSVSRRCRVPLATQRHGDKDGRHGG